VQKSDNIGSVMEEGKATPWNIFDIRLPNSYTLATLQVMTIKRNL
jgi:hypothetical protein